MPIVEDASFKNCKKCGQIQFTINGVCLHCAAGLASKRILEEFK